MLRKMKEAKRPSKSCWTSILKDSKKMAKVSFTRYDSMLSTNDQDPIFRKERDPPVFTGKVDI